MARQTYAGEDPTPIRRSRRITGRRRAEIPETSRMGARNNRSRPIRSQIHQDPREDTPIHYDAVSMHNTDTNNAEEEEERPQEERVVEEAEENMTIEQLRQQLAEERRRKEELRANLTQQNDELREENQRLHERRSQSRSRTTNASSRSRTSRNTSRSSRSDRKDGRQERFVADDVQVRDKMEIENAHNRYIQEGANEAERLNDIH